MDNIATTIHKIFASHLMVLCAHKIQATQEIKDNTVGQMMVMYVDKVICLCAQLWMEIHVQLIMEHSVSHRIIQHALLMLEIYVTLHTLLLAAI